MAIIDLTKFRIASCRGLGSAATPLTAHIHAALYVGVAFCALLIGGCTFGAAAAPPASAEAAVIAAPDSAASQAEDAVPAIAADAAPLAADAGQPPAADSEETATILPEGPWRYTTNIEPVDAVTIVTEVSGQVLEIHVREGDRVSAGQVLLSIDSTTLEAERAAALAGLQAAQAQVELLRVKASDADIEAARAEVAAAAATYQRALDGPSEEELTAAQLELLHAEATVRQAQAAYDQVAWNPLIAAMPENLQLQEAILALEVARAQYHNLITATSPDAIARAYAQLAAARAQLRRLEDGPDAAQLAAAEAEVHQAETTLYLAQLQLQKATLRAPFGGVVAEVNLAAGAMAQSGSPALRIISPNVKLVFPVEESRMAKLRLGQTARIQVNAYPGQTFAGAVTAIAPQLDSATRTVRVTVEPTDAAAPLAPGMSATVELIHE